MSQQCKFPNPIKTQPKEEKDYFIILLLLLLLCVLCGGIGALVAWQRERMLVELEVEALVAKEEDSDAFEVCQLQLTTRP